MKIRKVFLFSSAIILSLCLVTFIGVNVYASLKENENTKIVEKIKDVIPNDIYLIDSELSLPTLEINDNDYIGIVKIRNLTLPVQGDCLSSYLKIQSTCSYSHEPFIIIGTNEKNSIPMYKDLYIDDTVEFTNMLGEIVRYKIDKIKNAPDIDKLIDIKSDLIIVVKDYYSLENIAFICSRY